MTLTCPCCNQPWSAADDTKLPMWVLRPLAFEFVERELGCSEKTLKAGRRSAVVVEARALFVWICKTFGPADVSYPRIGRWLEKDHSSIHHLWHEVAPRLIMRDPDFAGSCGRFAEFALTRQETVNGDTRH